MSSRFHAAVLTGLAMSCAGTAYANDGAPFDYNFSGYGTLGLAHSSEQQADYIGTLSQSTGAGYTKSWSPGVDSRLAGQLTVSAGDQWSAVVQVVAEHQPDNSYSPKVEWANVQYRPIPDLSIRVGRIVLANLLSSNTRKVGYTFPGARLPDALYTVMPLTSSDGVDVSYSANVGGFKNVVTVNAGTKDYPLSPGAGLSFRKIRGIVDVLTRGGLTLQASRLQTTFSNESGTVRSPTQYTELGASYDPGDWFVTGEFASVRTTIVADSIRIVYVTTGYRFENFTPYVTLLNRSGGVTSSPVARPVKSAIAGIRWDFMRNTDFKLDYERNSLGAGSASNLTNFQPEYRPGGKFHVVSATVDFVF